MQQEFHRIKRLPPYVFNEVNAMKAKARAAGADLIDFGMGNPDSPTPAHIVDKLTETVRDLHTHVGIGLVENRQRTCHAIRNNKAFLRSFDPAVTATGARRMANA